MTETQEHKAIHVTIGDTEFRSHLEFRYTLVWDYAYITHVFEPHWLGKGPLAYLPDFYLPQSGIYVEVKGNDGMCREGVPAMTAALKAGLMPKGVLLLGPLYECETGRRLHPLIRCVDGELVASWAWFRPGGVEVYEGVEVLPPARLWCLDTEHLRSPDPNKRVVEAYSIGLKHRFRK